MSLVGAAETDDRMTTCVYLALVLPDRQKVTVGTGLVVMVTCMYAYDPVRIYSSIGQFLQS